MSFQSVKVCSLDYRLCMHVYEVRWFLCKLGCNSRENSEFDSCDKITKCIFWVTNKIRCGLSILDFSIGKYLYLLSDSRFTYFRLALWRSSVLPDPIPTGKLLHDIKRFVADCSLATQVSTWKTIEHFRPSLTYKEYQCRSKCTSDMTVNYIKCIFCFCNNTEVNVIMQTSLIRC